MGYLENLLSNVIYGFRKRSVKKGKKAEAIELLEKLEDLIEWSE